MGYRQARAEFDRPPQFMITHREIGRDENNMRETKCGIGFGQVFIEREGFG